MKTKLNTIGTWKEKVGRDVYMTRLGTYQMYLASQAAGLTDHDSFKENLR